MEWGLKPIYEDQKDDWELIQKGCSVPT